MPEYVLAIQPSIADFGSHDSSAAIFESGSLVFAVEEERYTREKHAIRAFPTNAIEACLDYCDVGLPEVDTVVVPWRPNARARHDAKLATEQSTGSERKRRVSDAVQHRMLGLAPVEAKLREVDEPIPEVVTRGHHESHAASAFYPSPFEEALVLTIDGRGDVHSTVVWKATGDSFEQVRTYDHPNSIALFYAAVTEYLGYRALNGEGKVMGLAPYGTVDEEIRETLLGVVETGVDYDVTGVVKNEIESGVEALESVFGRPRSEETAFTQWEKNLARVTQDVFEEIVTDVVAEYADRLNVSNVCLAGGGALNCKMNKRVAELDAVSDLFVQPVANDAGTPIGAGLLEGADHSIASSNVYLGPRYDSSHIERRLEQCKLEYSRPENLVQRVAEAIADGALVGWFQGRMELGPRALGNRSILADPRTRESKDRVNEFVKHRETWRPFAPSILEERADEYFKSIDTSPFMIETFDVRPEKTGEIPAVLHPGDDTARPQTVREDQNPRYYQLLRSFEEITGVPVLLNTSFNDHGEPIVTTPIEAIRDFYGMGLDVLVLGDYLLTK